MTPPQIQQQLSSNSVRSINQIVPFNVSAAPMANVSDVSSASSLSDPVAIIPKNTKQQENDNKNIQIRLEKIESNIERFLSNVSNNDESPKPEIVDHAEEKTEEEKKE